MRKLAVCVSFMNDTYRRQIDAAAEAAGFVAHYYDTQAGLTPHIGDYEVLYGHPAPALLRQASQLRWLCSDYAGVEKYLDDAVWPRPDCLLSNASGAYGPTISEHILMVLLMLLRRMPEYQADLSRRQWTYYAPIRSVIGSHIVVLGAGDIGSNTARRLKALGASVTGVCRSGRSAEPAFDRVLPTAELDRVLPTTDALVMALPATPETAGILSREGSTLMRTFSYIWCASVKAFTFSSDSSSHLPMNSFSLSEHNPCMYFIRSASSATIFFISFRCSR